MTSRFSGPNDRKKNLVVRFRGTGAKKPVLLNGHLDVVEARREDWTTDPFQFVEKDGYFYGRGTQDMKSDDAIYVANLIRLHREGYKPDRDIILALTADEEGGKSNGVDWLLQNHRDLIDAEFALDADNGGVNMENGKVVSVAVEPTEKLYGDYQLEVTNHGGHSSLPVPDNAIYHLSDGIGATAAVSVSDGAERRDARVLRGDVEDREGAGLGRYEGNSARRLPMQQRLRGSRLIPNTTPCCGPPAFPRASMPATPTMRCHSGRPPTSTAASCHGTHARRSVRS